MHDSRTAPKSHRTIGSDPIQEARIRLEAVERVVLHAVVSGDVYELADLGDWLVLSLAAADRQLALAGAAA